MNRIPIVSLFCGCGGLDLGFTQEGFEVLLALDISQSAVRTYNLNHSGQVAQVADLTKLDGQDIIQMLNAKHPNVSPCGVIGGPPCQTFSHSNVYTNVDDIGRTLPAIYAKIAGTLNRYYNLDFFVFENVRGITFRRHLKEFENFRHLFEEAGFQLYEDLLDAQYFGVPQKRPRVFVVGLNKYKYPGREFKFPKQEHSRAVTVTEAIRGLPQPRYFERSLKPTDIPVHPNHWTMQPKSKKFQNGSLVEGYNGGRSFRVLSWNQPSWAVAYGNREIHIHPSGKRRLSIYEAMLLQGFPARYQLLGTLSDQVQQVSDAVPPPVASPLARSLRQFLKKNADT